MNSTYAFTYSRPAATLSSACFRRVCASVNRSRIPAAARWVTSVTTWLTEPPSRTSPTRPTVFRHFCLSRDPRLGGSRMRLAGAVVRPRRAGSAHRPGYIHRRRRSRLSGQPGRSARHSRSGPARGITAGGATDRAVVAEPSMIHRRKLFWQTELSTTIMGKCRFRRARTSPCWPWCSLCS
jgi:hypothetical protein